MYRKVFCIHSKSFLSQLNFDSWIYGFVDKIFSRFNETTTIHYKTEVGYNRKYKSHQLLNAYKINKGFKCVSDIAVVHS